MKTQKNVKATAAKANKATKNVDPRTNLNVGEAKTPNAIEARTLRSAIKPLRDAVKTDEKVKPLLTLVVKRYRALLAKRTEKAAAKLSADLSFTKAQRATLDSLVEAHKAAVRKARAERLADIRPSAPKAKATRKAATSKRAPKREATKTVRAPEMAKAARVSKR